MRSQDSVGCRAVGNVTDALRAKGMWDNLLILSTSDNGGPVYKGNGWSGHDFVGTGHMGGNNFRERLSSNPCDYRSH